MAINTIKATIQMRKGLERDFDADQMTAGEWAVSTDTKYVRMCFAPGIVLRMATYEGFEVDMEEIRDILNECQDIQTAVDAMAKLAEKHKNDSEKSAKLSESWAKGETGIRAGEDTNNSKYFSGLAEILVAEAEKLLDQAQKVITASTQGALIPGGTVAFQDLPTNPAIGFMYNISNDFTTDNRFEDGAGIFYRAGANVYWTSGGKWDVLIGTQVTGVKGAKELSYRVGNVNITPENIGAMDAEAGIVLQEEVDNIGKDYWSLKSGTKILHGNDLNNYTTPGNYICDTVEIVRSLLNSPFENVTSKEVFNMKVYLSASNNESKKWVAQRIITWGTGQEFYRYALDENAQSFSEWIKISDNAGNYYSLTGGVEYTNDTQPDLNTIITPGNYFAYSVTISQSQIDNLHFPVTCSAYTLKVESTVGRGNYFTQIFKPYQSNYAVYERHKFGSQDWTDWVNISENLNNYWSLSGGTAIPEGADLNTYTEIGNYYCAQTAVVKTLLNCPVEKAFLMKVFNSIGTGYRSQEIVDYRAHMQYYRSETALNSGIFEDWKQIDFPLINNLTTQESGKGALDASQGAVLKGYFNNRDLAVKQANTQAELDAILNELSFYYSEYRLIITGDNLSLSSGNYYVITSKTTNSYAVQFILSYIGYGTMILRSFYNGVWYERQAVFKENLNTMAKTLTRFIDIPDNADMKSSTYIIPGCYMCRSIVSARTLKNCPIDMAFTLEVSYATGSSGYIMQKFISYKGDKIFCRMIERSSGVWSPAYRYDGNVKKTTIQKTDLSNLENISICNFYIYKQNNIVTIMINLNASMKASTEYKTVLILPAEYHPVDFMIESYTTQEGYVMGFEILSDGRLNLYNKNTNVSGWIVRKTITYFSKE